MGVLEKGGFTSTKTGPTTSTTTTPTVAFSSPSADNDGGLDRGCLEIDICITSVKETDHIFIAAWGGAQRGSELINNPPELRNPFLSPWLPGLLDNLWTTRNNLV